MKSTKACSGCYNDFYNGHNQLGVKKCWWLDRAKIITRYRIPVSLPMDRPDAFQKVRAPDCYREQGYAHYDALPPHIVQMQKRKVTK